MHPRAAPPARNKDPILLGVLLLWAALWAFNNSLPYLGLRDDSCQTMFSGQADPILSLGQL